MVTTLVRAKPQRRRATKLPVSLPALAPSIPRLSTVCPHCGGRLFLEREYPEQGRLSFCMSCINCARQFSLDVLVNGGK